MYFWIVITGGVFAFIAAMGIGANDVANAYATSIGSKSLTIRQAVVLASIFEAGGAILMGSHVTKTIRKGIADYKCFEDDPGSLMYGSMWVCFSVAMWLFIASKYEMPVSTTHSCVGGMVGMTLVLKGSDCVIWYQAKDTFPFIGGVAGIVVSWIISPVFSAILSSSLFGILRTCFLRSEYSFYRSSYVFPIMVGATVTLNTFYIVYKGAKGLGLDDTPIGVACAWAFGIGGVSGLGIIPLTSYIKKRITDKIEQNKANDIELEMTRRGVKNIDQVHNDNSDDKTCYKSDCLEKKDCTGLVKYVNDSLKIDINEVIASDENVLAIHDSAEKFEPKTEELFKSLQVFTAICDSFSHGANDVANAIGPFAAIYIISRENEVNKKSELGTDAYWILALGGAGISLGLAVYGYKIIQAIGLKLCKITPSRGVAIELASALVIITGSRLEIPLSTTHCQIGATMGVAALENPKTCSGMNNTIVFKTIVGWVITLIIVGSTAAVLTAQGAYGPETTGP
tara:strand:- start:2133 stop:3668 length:1536 start_codon:yes stop_codon:yes gene_type:complete